MDWQGAEQTQGRTLHGVCDLVYIPPPGMTLPLTVRTGALCLPNVLVPACFAGILQWALAMGVVTFLILLHQEGLHKPPPPPSPKSGLAEWEEEV